MAIKCPQCHSDNTDTARFCSNCAAPLPSSKEIPVTETLETPAEELTTGTIFAGRYQIIEELGKGGMGKVYKAIDKKLNEEVALKLIKPEIASDKKTLERFNNELKFARKIAHKNVGRMYELMEEKGTHFITMEYVPGQDLRGLIRQSGQLAVGTSISIAKQVCEGLTEAHRLGVIHRDLKPQNIMIDKEGMARIMDFGIARSASGKGITGAGVMVGTPEYMSPEQVESKETDQRSDIYSLGVILYEMVTGRLPFEGDTPLSVAVKHKTEAPPDPKQINTQIPEDLSRLILRCMEKDKEKRYQSAGEVRAELENIEKGIPTTEKVIPKRKPITSKEITVTFGLKKLLIPALAVVAVVIAVLIILQILPKEKAAPIPSDKPSIAVLPFEDLSSGKDQAYLCDGMTEELIAKLSKFKGWKVMNRNSVMQYKWTDKDIKEIGQELNVATILLGTVRKEEDDIRVTAQLVNVEDRFQIWSGTYEQKLEHVFMIQSEIAEKIVEALQMELSPEAKEQIQKKPTENIEAYNLYLQGRFFWNKRTEEGINKSIEFFERAIEIDSNYALAYAGLADSYNMHAAYENLPIIEAVTKAKAAAAKALELDESLAEAHTSMALVKSFSEWDWPGIEREFKRAIELNPNYAIARQWYAEYLAFMGRPDEAVAEIQLAQELDPLSLIIHVEAGRIYYFNHQFDLSIKQYQRTLDMDPNYLAARFFLSWAYTQNGMCEKAIHEAKKAMELSKNITAYNLGALGMAYGFCGMNEEANKVLTELLELSKNKYVSPATFASMNAALGENDKALEWLEKAVMERGIRTGVKTQGSKHC